MQLAGDYLPLRPGSTCNVVKCEGSRQSLIVPGINVYDGASLMKSNLSGRKAQSLQVSTNAIQHISSYQLYTAKAGV